MTNTDKMKGNKIWVVIPAYNEEKNISNIVKNTRKYVNQVVVVDDGSKDSTERFGREGGAIVLKHIVNLGKGSALKTGCDYAIRKGARFIIALDADAQHKPDDIPRFMEKLNKYDIVFSYRKASSKMPLVLKFGNWFISKVVGIMYNVHLNDTQSGFRAFSKQAYKKIRWVVSDYSMESEMVARTGKSKLKYVQIPIETVYSDKYKGTTVMDGIKIVFNMIWWKISNNR